MEKKSAHGEKERDRLFRKAAKLRVEVNELAAFLYNLRDRDLRLQCDNLKTYRTEMLRGFLISLHLAIEDLLKALLFDFLVKNNRSLPTRGTIRMVDDMRSVEIMHWCRRLKVISTKRFEQLLELNRVRNACAHNWIIDIPKTRHLVHRGRRRRERVPAVTYKNKNLFDPKVFSDDFLSVYSNLYLKLLFRVWRVQGKI